MFLIFVPLSGPIAHPASCRQKVIFDKDQLSLVGSAHIFYPECILSIGIW